MAISSDFFAANRERFMSRLQGGLAVITAYTSLQRSNDMAFVFNQEANFWYFTGIESPNWKVIIDSSSGDVWLVEPKIDSVHDLFDGSLSQDEAKRISGITKIITEHEGNTLLMRLAKKHSIVHTIVAPEHASYFDFSLNPALAANVKALERYFGSVRSCQNEVTKLRAIKQPVELKAMQKAISLSIDSFERIKQKFDTYKYEYEIEADFNYDFRVSGANGHAYDPIIAGAGNACTLHYSTNQAKLRPNSLVLIDVGASSDGYAADITRTYAKGEPTIRQKKVHQAVQDAHQQIIALLKAGLSVQDYASSVEVIMNDSLKTLDLYKDAQSYRTYFPHAVSHGLGIDVHDALGSPRYFEENMVITVEPGIYIPQERIGVRIEDDIVITKQASKNMSAKLSTDW